MQERFKFAPQFSRLPVNTEQRAVPGSEEKEEGDVNITYLPMKRNPFQWNTSPELCV